MGTNPPAYYGHSNILSNTHKEVNSIFVIFYIKPQENYMNLIVFVTKVLHPSVFFDKLVMLIENLMYHMHKMVTMFLWTKLTIDFKERLIYVQTDYN